MNLKMLWEQGREELELEIAAGEKYLDRDVTEKAINRPGLALTGFFQYFAHKRIQVFGLAELTYLKSLSSKERENRLREFFGRHIPALVISRHRHMPPIVAELAEEFKTPVFRTPMITSHFINECTVLVESLTAPRKRTQGTMLDIMGVGVLLRGKPGIGKSETALSLIERGYSLVSDDVTDVRRISPVCIMGCANKVTRYHMEIRGLGIIHVPSLFGVASIRGETAVDLVIDLEPPETVGEHDRTGTKQEYVKILGVEIPRVALPVMPGRDMANIVEVTALNQKLKQLGHDAAKELDDRLVVRMRKRAGG